MAGPKSVKYISPLVDALKQLGNSGHRTEVLDIIAEKLQLSDEVLNDQLKSGQSRFANQVDWAKLYLMKGGYLSSSQRGVWNLTEKGVKSKISEKDALDIFQAVRKETKNWTRAAQDAPAIPHDHEDRSLPNFASSLTGDHRSDVLELLKKMAPDSFERLCQRFLREAGFQQVEVTGRSGDGGIDGKGLLEINPLMSIHVLFQCKRYKGSVGAEAIRNFRGAMTGRTDKGIFITTGTFTADAHREATREGAPPIELVDADKLISMFEKLELGLKPRTVYEVDKDFFREFA